MAGIMKFFKPTEGAAGTAKKSERQQLNNTAREPFSPVGNKTEVHKRATLQPAEEDDSDVEVVGEDVAPGSKRKRGGNGQTLAAGTHDATPSQRAEHTELNQRREGILGDNSLLRHPGDASEAKAVAAGAQPAASGQLAAVLPAPATADQTLSPDKAALPPSPKRQRLPDDVTASTKGPEPPQPHQQKALHQPPTDGAVTHDPDGDTAMTTVSVPPSDLVLGSPGALAPAESRDVERARQSTPLPAQRRPHQDDQPSPSQQSVGAAAGSCPGPPVPASAGTAAAAAAAAAAAGPGAGTGGAGAKSGGAGPATLPPDLNVGSTLEALRKEQAGLEAALEEEVLLGSGLQASAEAAEGGRLAAVPSPAELCLWLEGRTQPLAALVAQLEALLPPGTDPAALRTSLVDLAQRKCYSAKEAPLEGVAASEDATPGRLWVWEVREPKKHLSDKATRKLAELQRKRRKELRERLTGVAAAAEALAAHQALLASAAAPAPGTKPPTAAARRTSESRAAKAWNRLSKLPDLEAIEGSFRSASDGLGAVAGGSAAKRERRDKEEKARQREEEARAKEEKARQREEEARAKEAKKAQEEEAKRRAKEAAAAHKAGFASKEGLRKSQNIMESFFKRPGQARAAPAGGGGSGAAAGAAAPGTCGPGQNTTGAPDGSSAAAGASEAAALSCGGAPSGAPSQPHQQQLPSHHQAAVSQPGVPTPLRDGPTMFNFTKVVCRLPDQAVVAAMDGDAARLPLPPTELAADLQRNHERWKGQRAARKRMIGVPPTWARRPNAPTDIRVLAAQYYGDVAAMGLAPETLRTWRRKLIAFPQKESARPPYYGSFSRTSTSVTGRRPFGRDTTLDYEVASDEEWEEEPEGESLSDSGDEGDSQAGGPAGDGAEEEDDGFIVGDDHLSDDEGAQLSGDPDDPMDIDGAGGKQAGRGGAAAAAAGSLTVRHMDPRLQQLESAIDRVRTNNRPILLVKPLGPPAQPTPASAPTAGAATPGGRQPPPSFPAASPAGAAAAAAAAAAFPAAEPASARADLTCQIRAEPRPGLNTGLDPGLLGALRPVVHRPDIALAPPLDLDVFSAHALAAQGGAGAAGALAGWGPAVVAAGGGGAAAGLGAGTAAGCAEGTLAAAFAAAAAAAGAAGAADLQLHHPPAAGAVGAGRAPGSSHRGRPPGPSLSEATLAALAEFMERCGDLKMDKIVEGFLASMPPDGTKQPAKSKLREAVKRLGAWSASGKRWLLHGGSVAAAVLHATEAAAAAAAAATPQDGTPLAASGAAAAATAVMAARRSGAGTLTPTAGLLPGMSGLPAPTPAPRLGPLPSPLPTPSTIGGGQPLLQAPACTPQTGAPPLRPTGQQTLLPQHLAAALSKLAGEAPAASPQLPAATPGTGLTPAAVTHKLVATTGVQLTSALKPPQPRRSMPLAPQLTSSAVPLRAAVGSSGGLGAAGGVDTLAGSGAAAAAAVAAGGVAGGHADAMDCDVPAPSEDPAGGRLRGALPGGSAVFGSSAGAATAAPQTDPIGAHRLQGQQQGAEEEAGRSGAGAEVNPTAASAAGTDGAEHAGGPGRPAVAGPASAPAVAQLGGCRELRELPRPMPGDPPPPEQMALMGTGHPYWRDVAAWVLGGGSASARLRRHGPSWSEVSRALAVFEAGELEPRLASVSLDVVRALLAVCQHRRPSHLRSGAFKALGNLAVVLAAAATSEPGGSAGSPSLAQPRGRRHGKASAATAAAEAAGAQAAVQGQAQQQQQVPPSFVAATGTGQPSRCSPQPVTLLAFLRLPGLLEALRRGCCHSDPDSETDKAARGAARMLAALVGVGIRPLSCAAPFAAPAQVPQPGPEASSSRTAQEVPASAPAIAAAAAVFRLKVASDPDLHAALRDVATRPPRPDGEDDNAGAAARPSSARCVYHAHMLLALQRLLRDPASALRVSKPKVRVAKEVAAAAEGKPAPPPPSADVESKWAAKLLQSLAVSGREVAHAGCRKGLMQCAVALLDHPRLAAVMPATQPEQPEDPLEDLAGGGGTGAGSAAAGTRPPQPTSLGALLSGNDPRTQMPAVCLTLLASELRHVAGSGCEGEGDVEGGEALGPKLDKCTQSRVLLGLHAAARALRHLMQPSSRQRLRQCDTRTAVEDVRSALEEASEMLSSAQDPLLQSLAATVTSLACEASV